MKTSILGTEMPNTKHESGRTHAINVNVTLPNRKREAYCTTKSYDKY